MSSLHCINVFIIVALFQQTLQTKTAADEAESSTKPNDNKLTRSSQQQLLQLSVEWRVTNFTRCSVTCGSGIETAIIRCFNKTTGHVVISSKCRRATRPDETRPCLLEPCPSWFTGEWSQCLSECKSATGYQLRVVACAAGGNCTSKTKPSPWKPCDVSKQLSCHRPGSVASAGPVPKLRFESQPKPVDMYFQSEETRSLHNDDDYQVLALRGGTAEDSIEISAVPSFFVGSWGPCSATCGIAVKTRRVECRAFDEETLSVRDLPDSRCAGVKPYESEYCVQPLCSQAANNEFYSWSFTGFGPCSKPCGGGSQDPVFTCVKLPDFVTVKSSLCSRLAPPPVERRPCNQQSCPPRWRSFPYGPCSEQCGGGQQIRHIQCVLELPVGPGNDSFYENVVVVSDDKCNASTAPPRSSLCNLAPCPPTWSIDSWSECSVSCGPGVQRRQVRCEQKIAAFNIATVPDSLCIASSRDNPLQSISTRPVSEQPCYLAECPDKVPAPRKSVIRAEHTDFVLLFPRDKIHLDVGGNATLLSDSTVNIFCPVRRRFARTKLIWKRGDKVITSGGRFKVTNKGVLRIRKLRQSDGGIYSCVAGQDSASIAISLHTEDEALQMVQQMHELSTTEHSSDSEDYEDERQDDGTAPLDPHEARRLLSSRNPESVPLTFVPGPWSECTRSCGGAGLQSRDVTCEIRGALDYRLAVDESHCIRRGLTRPIDMQDCGYVMCPLWESGPWGECSAESCVAVGTGTRYRETYCVALNGTILNNHQCPIQYKPEDMESCQQEGCVAMWLASNWTKCSLSCGGRGVRTRSLQCVWASNKQPADEHCDALPKPSTTRHCYTSPCMDTGCRDESKYCSLIPALHMCRYPQYRRECCHSCMRHGLVAPTPSPRTAPRDVTV